MDKSFIEELTDFVSCLDSAKSTPLDGPLQWVVSANGGTLFDDNMILFGFENLKQDPTLVAKVPRLRKPNNTLQNEYDRLYELWERLGPDAALYLPRPVAYATLQKQPVLILTYVPGENVLRGSKGSDSQGSNPMLALAREAAQSLRFFNERTATPLNGNHIESDLDLKVEKFRQLYTPTEEELRALNELVVFSRKLSRSATHKVMNQGDFWAGNMIRNVRDHKLMILDWQFAHWSVDVSMDVYLFLLDGALAAVSETPPAERATRAALMLSAWKRDIVPAYLETYGTPKKYVLLPPRFGMMLCCVEKAVRSALDFGFHHPNDLIWRSLFTEVMDWTD